MVIANILILNISVGGLKLSFLLCGPQKCAFRSEIDENSV